MLTIKSTPNLQGISLQGDYQDLNRLYDALSRYLEFYQKNAEGYPYHEYEYLLALNYDIRHAYMDTREYLSVENNASEYGLMAESIFEVPEEFKSEIRNVHRDYRKGNLYFSVNILYPLVFHYLISLERILDDYYLPSWFDAYAEEENPYIKYDPLEANHDRAQIQMFTSLLWDNIAELFGKEKALAAYNYFADQEFGFAPALYIDALLHHQAANFDHLSPEQRKDYLYLTFMEIMDSDELLADPKEWADCYGHYQTAFKAYNQTVDSAKKEFPTQNTFHREFHRTFDKKEHLYQEDFERFLIDWFGEIDEESEPEW